MLFSGASGSRAPHDPMRLTDLPPGTDPPALSNLRALARGVDQVPRCGRRIDVHLARVGELRRRALPIAAQGRDGRAVQHVLQHRHALGDGEVVGLGCQGAVLAGTAATAAKVGEGHADEVARSLGKACGGSVSVVHREKAREKTSPDMGTVGAFIRVLMVSSPRSVPISAWSRPSLAWRRPTLANFEQIWMCSHTT